MSWLARSIANSLRLDGEDEGGPDEEDGATYDVVPPEDPPRNIALSAGDRRSSSDGGGRSSFGEDEDVYGDDDRRGVKDDLSELKDSLARQLWGVASFLAPPPPPPPPPPLFPRSGYESVARGGGETGQFGQPEEDYHPDVVEGAIGITEEVLAFAKDIAHHPETWLDFPLSEEEEFDDFDISDAQFKHALAVEHLAPRLAALRIELCPVHMSEGYFWMVYFVLLHSRLNKHDADLLSSSQMINLRADFILIFCEENEQEINLTQLAQARIMWMHELEKRTKEELPELSLSTEPLYSPHQNSIMHSDNECNDRFGNDPKQVTPVEKHEVEFIDKSVIKEDLAPELHEKEMIVSSTSLTAQDYDHDDDDWLKDVSDFIGYSDKSVMGNEEDISFSDLEDDLDHTMPVKYNIPNIPPF
ncbi:BSD domain-containing family protein [Striga asiatica]|uniref:BSD domain-containing family protein n=1 Tax=Striga asiatica TaxID=4170 RepID=A0A5A7QNQ5_STRAF|nr:BSD domain-containing family protein [Striga asiatica]